MRNLSSSSSRLTQQQPRQLSTRGVDPGLITSTTERPHLLPAVALAEALVEALVALEALVDRVVGKVALVA